MSTCFETFVLSFNSRNHVGIGPVPIHLLLKLPIELFGVFGVLRSESFDFGSASHQFLLQLVYLFFQMQIFLK